MLHLWRKLRTKWLAQDLLIVCSGSKGRVPLAHTSRTQGATATREGKVVSFDSCTDKEQCWHFTMVTKSEEVAKALLENLLNKKLFSLHPDEEILAVVFRRDDWGPEPQWIGGDLSLVDVDACDYTRHDNLGYLHRDAVARFEESDYTSN